MDSPKPDWGTEFSKDVAAMANSGGGMIIYGIEEDNAIATVILNTGKWSDDRERQLRNILLAKIQPTVHGVTFTEISDGNGMHLVALIIPDSHDSPHMFLQSTKKEEYFFAAPKRDGTLTGWMSEREIERAYQRRVDLRQYRETSIERLLEEAVSNVQTPTDIWLTLAAKPVNTELSCRNRINPGLFTKAIKAALDRRDVYCKQTEISVLRKMKNGQRTSGLRRWRYNYPSAVSTHNPDTKVVAELHDDGSVSVSVSLGGSGRKDISDDHLMGTEVEGVVADFILLIQQVGMYLVIPSMYAVRATISSLSNRPIYIRDVSPIDNTLKSIDESTPINDFKPVDLEFDYSFSEKAALHTMRDLARDLIGQGGQNRLQKIFRELQD